MAPGSLPGRTRIPPDFGMSPQAGRSPSYETKVLAVHPIMARISPDGKRVLTLTLPRYNYGTGSGTLGGIQPTATVWNAATGAKLATWKLPDNDARSPMPHNAEFPDPRHVIGFSPDGNSVVLATGGQPAPRVWDTATSRELFSLEGHDAPVVAVDFSPNGKLIATGSVDHTARLWDAATGKSVGVFRGHSCGISTVLFSPDSQRVLSLGNGFKHVATDAGGKLSRVNQQLSDTQALAEPMGFIWDTAKVELLVPLKWPKPDFGFCAMAQFSPDGSRVVTAGERSGSHISGGQAPDRQNNPNIWSAKTGALLHTLIEPGRTWKRTGYTISASFSAGGRYVQTTHRDERFPRLWDAVKGVEVATNFVGHDDSVLAAAFSPDGRLLATGSQDGTARLWDIAALRPTAPHLQRWLVGGGVALSSDGRRLAVVGQQQFQPGQRPTSPISIWDLETGQETVCKGGISVPLGMVVRNAMSHHGRWLACSSDKLAQLWDAETGQPGPLLQGHENTVLDIQFSPNDDRIATVSSDGTVRIWETVTGQQKLVIQKSGGHVSFSPDGDRLLIGSVDSPNARGNQGWIVDVETGKDIAAFGSAKSISHLSMIWSPDGQRILAPVIPQGNLGNGQAVKSISLCDAATGQEISRLTGHTMPIHCACFSPDGRWVLTGSRDHSARVWDAVTGATIVVLGGYQSDVSSVAFSANGRWAVSMSAEAVQLWDTTQFSKRDRSIRAHAVLAGDAEKRIFQTANFCPDGRWLLTEYRNTAGQVFVQLWPTDPMRAAAARAPRTLTAEERELYNVP